MTDDEFLTWAAKHGLPPDRGRELIRYAATPEEMDAAAEAMLPGSPIYTLESIMSLADEDPFGVSPLANGFLIIGSCPNGDPIALDVSVSADVGSVWYVSHESMHANPLRKVAIRVADDVADLMERMANGNAPWDYFEAKQRLTSES